MQDLVITMPEAVGRDVLASPDDRYFFHRTGRGRLKYHDVGGRVFFVFSGHLRGFGRTHAIRRLRRTVSLDGKCFQPGWYLRIYPESWRWIVPLPMRGFQGFRYSRFDEADVHIVGDFTDPQPDIVL